MTLTSTTIKHRYLAGCAARQTLETVSHSPEYDSIQKSWINCSFEQADRYLWADPDPQNIATAAEAACAQHPDSMRTLFIQRGVRVSHFEPLVDDLNRAMRRHVVLYVLKKRSN